MPNRLTCAVILIAPLIGLLLNGCENQPHQDPESSTGSTAAMQLPVSLNEVMVAMVNNAADPIWQAAWRPPETDEVWRSLERYAYQLEIAGSLLTVPGTGPLDQEWTSNPQWANFCAQLADAGKNARTAISNRDIEAIKLAGDDLVQICEGCHIALKPDEPTGGKYGELSPTAGDFEKE